jgi:hypothetical protein
MWLLPTHYFVNVIRSAQGHFKYTRLESFLPLWHCASGVKSRENLLVEVEGWMHGRLMVLASEVSPSENRPHVRRASFVAAPFVLDAGLLGSFLWYRPGLCQRRFRTRGSYRLVMRLNRHYFLRLILAA